MMSTKPKFLTTPRLPTWRRSRVQQGFSLIEVLIAMLLVSISALAIVESSILAIKSTKHSYRTLVANQLAVKRLEELAARDPDQLTSANAGQEWVETEDSLSFSRTVTILANADGSKTITVLVAPPTGVWGGEVEVSTTVAQRGAI